jgi:hypothetical protein
MSPKWSHPLRFPDQNFVCISHLLICATCPVHLILPDLLTAAAAAAAAAVATTTTTMIGEEYKL